jgi:hypothetical protein
MSPVPPALFKAKGTTLRADEYLRGVNPVGTVHRGPLSAFGRQECSALRTEPSVAFSRTDRLGGHPALLPGVLPPGRGQQGLRGVARARVPREARRPRASTASAAPRSANQGSRGGKPSAHRGGTRTSPRPPRAAATSRSNPTGPTNRSRGGARASACTGPSTAATTSCSTAASRNRSSARRPHEERHPYVNIGARTTRAERGRQTLGRAHGRALPIARRVQPRAAGSTRRGRVQAWRRRAADRGDGGRRSRGRRSGRTPESPRRRGNPRGSRAGTGRRRCGRIRASRAQGAYHETFDFRRQATGRGSPSNKHSTFNPKAASTYWGSTSPGRGSPIMGSSGKGSPGAGRTYPVSGREVRARTMSGRWTPRDEARGPKKLLGRASPTP